MDFINDISGIEVMLFLMMIGVWMIWRELCRIGDNLRIDVDEKFYKILDRMKNTSTELGVIENHTRKIEKSVTKIKENQQVI